LTRSFLLIPPPPRSPPFPYTTLFRSEFRGIDLALAESRRHEPAQEELVPPIHVSCLALARSCAGRVRWLQRTQRLANARVGRDGDRKSTRLNSSHVAISYAVFCLKKK